MLQMVTNFWEFWKGLTLLLLSVFSFFVFQFVKSQIWKESENAVAPQLPGFYKPEIYFTLIAV